MAALLHRRTFEYHDRGKGLRGDAFDDPQTIDAAASQLSKSDRTKLAAFRQHVDRIDRAILHLDTCCDIFEDPHEV